MDTLCHSWENRVVVVDVHILQSFHLEGVQIHIDRKQVKGEVADVDVLAQAVALEKLFADDGAFGPETGEVLFDSFVFVYLDQLFQGD